jgi:hypothetical protein
VLPSADEDLAAVDVTGNQPAVAVDGQAGDGLATVAVRRDGYGYIASGAVAAVNGAVTQTADVEGGTRALGDALGKDSAAGQGEIRHPQMMTRLAAGR